MKKFAFPVFALILLLLTACGPAAPSVSKGQTLEGNLWLQTTVSDFKRGSQLENTTVVEKGDGAVELVKQGDRFAESGTFTSAPINTAPFKDLILSWNADTPAGTTVTIEGQIQADGEWSEWFSWGTWGTGVESKSVRNQKGKFAVMAIDTLKSIKEATALRYRLTLRSTNPHATPSVRLVAATIRNRQGQQIAKVYPKDEAAPAMAGFERDLHVPMYSQMVRDPKIASSICSPTSVTMVLGYYGIEKTPEEVASGVRDHEAEIFGNWPFNTAYAASYGLTAYVDFFNSLDDVKREIAKGHPVIASIKFGAGQLKNAPIDSTDGHLVVIRGFTHKDGKEYVIVNDPAAPNDATVRREYLADEFERAWNKVVYVIYKEE